MVPAGNTRKTARCERCGNKIPLQDLERHKAKHEREDTKRAEKLKAEYHTA